jgi:hypothetical protein
MKATRLLIGAITMCIIFSGLAIAIENPHEQIIIDEGVRPARFNHDTHLGYGVKCGVCHHKSKDDPLTNQEVISLSSSKTLYCSHCHNERFENEKLRSMRTVMHQRCKGCHQIGVDGVKGPLRCHGCHKIKKE